MSDPKKQPVDPLTREALKAVARHARRRAGVHLEAAIGSLLDVFPVAEVIKRLRSEADHLEEFKPSGTV